MLIRGSCHCGNISFTLDWKPEPSEIPARACSCSFCTKHGGVWTSCPGVAQLRAPDITMWAAWEDGELLGCAALKELDREHGEIKSMRTSSRHLRKGVATALLRHLLAEAKRRSYRRLSLETGSMAAFAPARELYARFGFKPCGPFADYIEDPNSVFMTRTL